MRKKKKILVVDDEKDIREIIKISLVQDGYTVIEAPRGRTAIQLAHEEKPDLITLDVMLPDIDGFEVAKALKEDPKTANIPIVILSVMSEDKKEYRRGIADYISKPFTPESLVDTVKKVIEEGGKSKQENNVLVVDDEPDVIDIITLCLKEKGFVVEGASNGVEALEKLNIILPHIIITDIEMPKMNGFELIKRLKQDPMWSSIPVIILTGTYISEHDRKHGILLGATKYITKPFKIQNLVQEIEGVLCKKQKS